MKKTKTKFQQALLNEAPENTSSEQQLPIEANNSKQAPSDDEDDRPVWDLSKFFNGTDDPAIDQAKKQIADNINEMIDERDLLPKMSLYEILTFVRRYENIVEQAHSLTKFASLNLCTQRDNQEALLFEKNTSEFIEKMFTAIQWVHNALFALPDKTKLEILQSQKFKPYAEWIAYQLLFPPTLSEAVARAVSKTASMSNDWHSLYKQITSKLNFTMGKKTYTLDEISELAYSHKDKATRDKALKCMSDEFKRYGYIFAQTLNSIYKKEDVITKIYLNGENEYDCTEISFDALDLDGFANGLSREDVRGIAEAVTDSYKPISQRFYKLLAKMQNGETFQYNDRLQNPVKVPNKKVSWAECLQIVLDTLIEFNPTMAMSGINIINSNIIHARPQTGKDLGAFCVSGDKPYIFLNYRNNMSSVLTFAHEFGHAIHHIYAHDNAGTLNDNTTITMSEVASLFNEKLIFNKLLSNPELSDKEKIHLLIEDVNRQIADIHRQIAFAKFEQRAFLERQDGELSEERFTQIYCDEMERYLGIPLQENAQFGWMGIPHVFNSPFYVRYYAFAGLVVNKLWQVYTSGRIENFADRYLDMLSNTGLEGIDDLLEPFELDMSSSNFWSSALKPISLEIDEIERLAKKEGLLS